MPSASAWQLRAAGGQVVGRQSASGCLPAALSSSAAPLALRERPPGACSPEGMPCSISALARTPCVHAAHLARRCPSASPPPTLSPLLGSAISCPSRLLHMAGSGPSRAIPPYLFGKSLQLICCVCTPWSMVHSIAARRMGAGVQHLAAAGLPSNDMIELRLVQAFSKARHT